MELRKTVKVIEDQADGAVYVFWLDEDGSLGDLAREYVFADRRGELGTLGVERYSQDFGSGDGKTVWCPTYESARRAADKFAGA